MLQAPDTTEPTAGHKKDSLLTEEMKEWIRINVVVRDHPRLKRPTYAVVLPGGECAYGEGIVRVIAVAFGDATGLLGFKSLKSAAQRINTFYTRNVLGGTAPWSAVLWPKKKAALAQAEPPKSGAGRLLGNSAGTMALFRKELLHILPQATPAQLNEWARRLVQCIRVQRAVSHVTDIYLA